MRDTVSLAITNIIFLSMKGRREEGREREEERGEREREEREIGERER